MKVICFDAKYLKMGLNGVDEICGALFQRKCPFWLILNATLVFKIRPCVNALNRIFKKCCQGYGLFFSA